MYVPRSGGWPEAMAGELPAGDFEKVPDADKAALAARIDEAEIMALVADLERRGYERRLPISGGRRRECSAMSEEGCAGGWSRPGLRR